jgi:phosphate transport system permease protein
MEPGLEVATPAENGVEALAPDELRNILEGRVENWATVGGKDRPIAVWHLDNLHQQLDNAGLLENQPSAEALLGPNYERLPALLDSLARAQPGVLLIFHGKDLPPDLQRLDVGNVGVASFLADSDWEPAETPVPAFGALPLLWGTILVTLGALIFSLLLGPPVAIYLAELADRRIQGFLKPMIELLAGIPSVVFGFLGLVVVVPFIRDFFAVDTGSTALAGSVLLAIVALPTIISVSEDAIRNVPGELKEASLAMGATHWQAIYSVILPYARPGILASIILGVGRIIGETMIVLMVTGNSPQLVGLDFLEPVRTMSAAIAAEMGEAPQGGLHYQSLFTVGCLLFLLTFLVNLVGEVIKQRRGLR